MMDAATWLAEFARRELEYLAWRSSRHARIAEKIRKEREPRVKIEIRPVVLEAGRDVDPGEVSVPKSARGMLALALGLGWSARLVRSLAAVPSTGRLEVVTVRARRHDERLWAAWENGRFADSWYVGPTGLERLGWSRLATLSKSAQTRAAKSGAAMVAPTTRGVLDVIEGIRGPKQWVDVLERREVERAVGLISAAFPGLSLTRQ